MSLIGNVSTILDNEKRFNILCHHMAKNNFSLASNYVEDIFTKSISNKDKFIHLTKTCFLALRIPLLYLPLVNRVTQLFLRLLSPKLTKQFVVDSPNFFQVEELKIRYSVKSLVNACIVYQTNPENKTQDIVKFIKEIRKTLDEKGLKELKDKQYTHAVPPEGLTISFV